MIRVFLAALLLWLPVEIGWAHTGGITGFATITVSGDKVKYSLTLSSVPDSPLSARMHPGRPDESPDYRPLVSAIGEKITVIGDGRKCVPGGGHVEPQSAKSVAIVATVDFACAGEIGKLVLRDDLSDELGPAHHTLALIVWSGGSQQFAFGNDARTAEFKISSKAIASRGAGSFFPLGIEHILSGYDHLLFLLALILRGGNLVQLLKTITGFTVAHSVTLALAALDVVTLPAVFVEAVIALSIAYVAAENLFPRYAISRRWAVSFVFGLVHGFGFSSVLREIGLPKENLLVSLLNFNLGVEVGQAVVVLMIVPVLIRLRRTRWEPKAVTAVSALILAFGLVLFAERIFFVPA
jgi:hypothetical protein